MPSLREREGYSPVGLRSLAGVIDWSRSGTSGRHGDGGGSPDLASRWGCRRAAGRPPSHQRAEGLGEAAQVSVRRRAAGVQEARISTSSCGGGRRWSRTGWTTSAVTVPPTATCAAPFWSSASVSQHQATVGSMLVVDHLGVRAAPGRSSTSGRCPPRPPAPRGRAARSAGPTWPARRAPRPGRRGVGLDADGPREGRQPLRRAGWARRPSPGAAVRSTARRARPELRRLAGGSARAGTLDRSAGPRAQARR